MLDKKPIGKNLEEMLDPVTKLKEIIDVIGGQIAYEEEEKSEVLKIFYKNKEFLIKSDPTIKTNDKKNIKTSVINNTINWLNKEYKNDTYQDIKPIIYKEDIGDVTVTIPTKGIQMTFQLPKKLDPRLLSKSEKKNITSQLAIEFLKTQGIYWRSPYDKTYNWRFIYKEKPKWNVIDN